MKAAKSHDVRITWADHAKDPDEIQEPSILLHRQKRQVKISQDPDEIIPLNDYKKEYGNPASNGHKQI
eukprot:382138-Lingulodinium_polyedra.AAC.1